ncbi:MAG: V-type ATP synthase subunit E family protein [Oscillospiraceae bacterium]|nr:V-type ATP synthase subunit E family protein [Oscillospiraceae bacterium]
MQGLEKILEHIKIESERECKEIAIKANSENKKYISQYSQKEKATYSSHMEKGKKEIENRVEQLSNLADEQSKKLIYSAEQSVLDDVLALTAKKLSALPANEYSNLLKRLGVEEGCKPEYLVEQYRDELTPSVISALFG